VTNRKRMGFLLLAIMLVSFLFSGCSGQKTSATSGENQTAQQGTDKGAQLMDAISNSEAEKVKSLLAGGANANQKDDLGNTPLIVACQYGNVEIVKILLEAGADPNVQDSLGVTPLVMAQENGYQEVADLLRKHGAK
jgi:ankyrin repeat protein